MISAIKKIATQNGTSASCDIFDKILFLFIIKFMKSNLVIFSTCIQCDSCNAFCPENAVITNGKDYYIDPWSCTKCQICVEVCPVDCIKEEQAQTTTLNSL